MQGARAPLVVTEGLHHLPAPIVTPAFPLTSQSAQLGPRYHQQHKIPTKCNAIKIGFERSESEERRLKMVLIDHSAARSVAINSRVSMTGPAMKSLHLNLEGWYVRRMGDVRFLP